MQSGRDACTLFFYLVVIRRSDDMKFFGGFALLLVLLAPCGSEARTGDLYARLKAASLEVLVDGRLVGSGWFVSPAGVGVTAAHLVGGWGKVEVMSPGFGRLKARLVAFDLGRDLAVFHVNRAMKPFAYLKISERIPAAGQQLHLFGSPLFRHGIMVAGEMAGDTTHFEWNDQNRCYTEVFPVNAMTPEGFSGAPWVDENGEVVGIQSGMMAWKGGLMGIAFMSPARRLKELLADQKDVSMATLGAVLAEPWEQPAGLSSGSGFASQGILVTQTFDGEALARASVVKGDAIMMFKGLLINSRDELLRKVRSLPPGTKVDLQVRRKAGSTENVSVELGKLR